VPFDYGTVQSVSVKKVEGGPILIRLEDGTLIEMRIAVVDVKRSVDRYDSNGDPVYSVGSVQLVSAKVPPRLKLRKARK
jgi:hypothetical protein